MAARIGNHMVDQGRSYPCPPHRIRRAGMIRADQLRPAIGERYLAFPVDAVDPGDIPPMPGIALLFVIWMSAICFSASQTVAS